jgi:hypothetical protein
VVGLAFIKGEISVRSVFTSLVCEIFSKVGAFLVVLFCSVSLKAGAVLGK